MDVELTPDIVQGGALRGRVVLEGRSREQLVGVKRRPRGGVKARERDVLLGGWADARGSQTALARRSRR